MTAVHVIDDIDTTRDGQRWTVFFSDGMLLGEPRTVFRGTRRASFPSAGSIWSKTISQ